MQQSLVFKPRTPGLCCQGTLTILYVSVLHMLGIHWFKVTHLAATQYVPQNSSSQPDTTPAFAANLSLSSHSPTTMFPIPKLTHCMQFSSLIPRLLCTSLGMRLVAQLPGNFQQPQMLLMMFLHLQEFSPTIPHQHCLFTWNYIHSNIFSCLLHSWSGNHSHEPTSTCVSNSASHTTHSSPTKS